MLLIAGIAAGLASMAAAGLGGVLLAMPSLQLAMRADGSAYLLWLAWQIAHRGSPHLAAAAAKPTGFVAGICILPARILRTDPQWRALNAAVTGLLAASVLPIWL